MRYTWKASISFRLSRTPLATLSLRVCDLSDPLRGPNVTQSGMHQSYPRRCKDSRISSLRWENAYGDEKSERQYETRPRNSGQTNKRVSGKGREGKGCCVTEFLCQTFHQDWKEYFKHSARVFNFSTKVFPRCRPKYENRVSSHIKESLRIKRDFSSPRFPFDPLKNLENNQIVPIPNLLPIKNFRSIIYLKQI